jgi:hypothetical protein
VQISRVLVGATLAGVLVLTAVPRAQAMDPYTQGLLSQMLSGLVLGAPYGAAGNLPSGGYGTSPMILETPRTGLHTRPWVWFVQHSPPHGPMD